MVGFSPKKNGGGLGFLQTKMEVDCSSIKRNKSVIGGVYWCCVCQQKVGRSSGEDLQCQFMAISPLPQMDTPGFFSVVLHVHLAMQEKLFFY